jgi:hypothetical protein
MSNKQYLPSNRQPIGCIGLFDIGMCQNVSIKFATSVSFAANQRQHISALASVLQRSMPCTRQHISVSRGWKLLASVYPYDLFILMLNTVRTSAGRIAKSVSLSADFGTEMRAL